MTYRHIVGILVAVALIVWIVLPSEQDVVTDTLLGGSTKHRSTSATFQGRAAKPGLVGRRVRSGSSQEQSKGAVGTGEVTVHVEYEDKPVQGLRVEIRHKHAISTATSSRPFEMGRASHMVDLVGHAPQVEGDALIVRETDSAGCARFDGLSPAMYELRVPVQRALHGISAVVLSVPGSREVVKIQLDFGDQTLVGRVISTDEWPIRCWVVLRDDSQSHNLVNWIPRLCAPTRSDGTFVINGLRSRRYRVYTLSPGREWVFHQLIDAPVNESVRIIVDEHAEYVHGTVVSKSSAAPISGARVITGSMDDDEAGSSLSIAHSDSKGRFVIRRPLSVEGKMVVEAIGFLTKTLKRVSHLGESDIGTVELETGCVIQGRILDDLGHPVPNVRLTAYTDVPYVFTYSNHESISGRDGAFRIEGIWPGTVGLVGRSETYFLADGDRILDMSTGEQMSKIVMEPTSHAEIQVRAVPYATLKGTLRASSGEPLRNAYVHGSSTNNIRFLFNVSDMAQLFGFSTDPLLTDSAGQFTIDRVPPDNETTIAIFVGGQRVVLTESLVLKIGETRVLDFTLPALRGLKLNIVDSITGDGIPDVHVVAKRISDGIEKEGLGNESAMAVTDSSGLAVLKGVPVGLVQIGVTSDTHFEPASDVQVDPEQSSVRIELDERSSILFEINLPAELNAEQIEFQLEPDPRDFPDSSTRLDVEPRFVANDTYSIDKLAAGRYLLSASATTDDWCYEGELTVATGQQMFAISVVRTRSRLSTRVRVVDLDGRKVTRGTVQIVVASREPSSESSYAPTVRLRDGEARFTFDEPPDHSDWVVFFQYRDKTDGWARINTKLKPLGQLPSEIVIQTEPALTISGRVHSEGAGVRGVFVNAMSEATSGASTDTLIEYLNSDGTANGALTSESGAFEIGGLASGVYRLLVVSPGNDGWSLFEPQGFGPHGNDQWRNVKGLRGVVAGTRDVSMELPALTTTRVIVLDEGGAPLSDAIITLAREDPRAPGSGKTLEPIHKFTTNNEGKTSADTIDPQSTYTVWIEPPGEREDELAMYHMTAWSPRSETTFRLVPKK